jgi:hypothetical protein
MGFSCGKFRGASKIVPIRCRIFGKISKKGFVQGKLLLSEHKNWVNLKRMPESFRKTKQLSIRHSATFVGRFCGEFNRLCFKLQTATHA